MPERLLVFGGTFDPPQRAHVALPREAARRLGCGRIVVVPTSANPLKDERPASAADRLAMLRLAFHGSGSGAPSASATDGGDPGPTVEILTFELDRPAPAYTVDTLLELRRRHGPAVQMRLLMGSDSALSFPRWRNPSGILDLATPAVMLRPPESRETFGAALVRMHEPLDADFWMRCVIEVAALDVSATEVRRRLATGKPVGDLLTPEVERYVRAKGLYVRESASPLSPIPGARRAEGSSPPA